MQAVLMGTLMPVESLRSVFRITLGANIQPGNSFKVFTTASAGYYSAVSNVIVPVGALTENFETGDIKSCLLYTSRCV